MNTVKITKRLAGLSIEDVMTLRDEHREDHTFWVLCNMAISEKKDIIREAEMEGYIDELLAKKNAPDGAATPSQGK